MGAVWCQAQTESDSVGGITVQYPAHLYSPVLVPTVIPQFSLMAQRFFDHKIQRKSCLWAALIYSLPIFHFPNPFQTPTQLCHRIELIRTIPTIYIFKFLTNFGISSTSEKWQTLQWFFGPLYVIHCKNTKLSMRIYKHHQGSTRIYELYNFPPPKSLFEWSCSYKLFFAF